MIGPECFIEVSFLFFQYQQPHKPQQRGLQVIENTQSLMKQIIMRIDEKESGALDDEFLPML